MVGLIKFLFILSILVFVFYILFIFTLKTTAAQKVLRISVYTGIISITIISFILYYNGISYDTIGQGRQNYVLGQIVSKENGKIFLKVVDHNLDEKKLDKVYVKISDNTAIRKQVGVFEREIESSSLNSGDMINVICMENSVTNKEVVAQKITDKN